MISLAHSPVVQQILDSWMPRLHSQPTEEDLRHLVKILEDKLDELGPFVEALQAKRLALDPKPKSPDPCS